MMIEFECVNYSGFDAATGRYIPCGHKIVVPSEKIGEQVRCPKCQQKVEVPVAKPPPRKPTQKPAKSSKKQRSTSRPESDSARKKAPKKGHSRQTTNTRQVADSDDIALSDPIQRPSSDLSQMSFGNTRTEQRPLSKDKRKRCLKCGALVRKNERCSSCGHLEQTFDKATKPLDQIKVDLSGFQLWFVETMSEGISFKVLAYLSHVLLGIFALLLIALAILGVGGVSGFVMIAAVVMMATLYVGMVIKGHQLAKDPHAKLAWFQKPFWNFVLWLSRSANWQNYDERFKGRMIIDRRGEGVTDDKIPGLEGIETCQVLDLEDTAVTDAGLRHLYGLQNLHCVVLRHTGVTDEGVFRLQQTKPKLWIWY